MEGALKEVYKLMILAGVFVAAYFVPLEQSGHTAIRIGSIHDAPGICPGACIDLFDPRFFSLPGPLRLLFPRLRF